ncbi:hypothetical protein LUZ62_006139 [Rhynchospora pubera]|uniref:NAD(P)-binding domain-containing protein n=1 Tax=Rhynchospora pubera TaxID=906938 RepID=A0AAV8BPR6_9POAL|nr:hypothetical protein LUZ62_006139 [Rhynchospora pubera]
MAPALTSNSFMRNPGLRPKPELKTQKFSTITHARQNIFGLGKTKDGPEEDESSEQPAANWKKFKSFFVDIELPNANSLIPVVSGPSSSLFNRRKKDPQTVFVAGATGQAGIRIAQTLLRQGFTVRAGVPDLPSAQELARIAATYKVISPAEAKQLNAVESAFSEPEAIAKAIGPATKVVVTIGPAENGPAAGVTTDEALQVVRAAELAAATHVVVVYDASFGVTSGSTYNVIDGFTTFFNNISSMFAGPQTLTIEEFMGKLVESDIRYTVIKTALTEDYSPVSKHGLVVSGEGNGSVASSTVSKVTKSQIAALVADVFSSASVAENKVVEVFTSPSATTKPVLEALSAIPEDGRRKEYEESVAKAKAEEAALIASQKARAAEDAVKKPPKVSKSPSTPSSTKPEQKVAGPDVTAVLENGFKEFSGKFSWDKLSAQLATAVAQKSEEEEEEKPKAQIATIRGLAKARKLTPQKAVIKQAPQRPKPKPKQPEPKSEVSKVFGIFKQETIYVDDD